MPTRPRSSRTLKVEASLVAAGKEELLLLPLLRVSLSACLSFSSICFSDRYGLIHQARISASVNAMRVLNTGTEVEAAVADALVMTSFYIFHFALVIV